MMSNPFSLYFYVFIVGFRVGRYQIWKNNGHLGRTYWSNTDMATFGNQQFLRKNEGKNVGKNEGENEQVNDRMNANNFCFLHYINTYTCWQVALMVFLPQ